MNLRRNALARASALASIGALALFGCTSFDDAAADGGYFDVADATRLCARLFSCPGLASSLRQSIAAPTFDTSFSLCMSWLAGPSPAPPGGFTAQVEALRKVKDAATCDAAASDLEVRVLVPDDPRCATSVDQCLDATHALDCHERRVVSCAGQGFGPGSVCVLSGDTARCSSSACAIANDSILACADNTLSICDPNLKQRYEIACAATGSTCVTSPTRVSVTATASIPVSACTSHDNELTLAAVCSGASGDGAASCSTDSASMVVCNRLVRFKSKGGVTTVGGVEALYHCQKELGWSCVEGAASAFAFCARPDADCAPGDADVDRCDGDRIAICLAGHRADVDCAAVGATCHGASGAARCELAP